MIAKLVAITVSLLLLATSVSETAEPQLTALTLAARVVDGPATSPGSDPDVAALRRGLGDGVIIWTDVTPLPSMPFPSHGAPYFVAEPEDPTKVRFNAEPEDPDSVCFFGVINGPFDYCDLDRLPAPIVLPGPRSAP